MPDDYTQSVAVLGVQDEYFNTMEEKVGEYFSFDDKGLKFARKIVDDITNELFSEIKRNWAQCLREDMETIALEKAQHLVKGLLQGKEVVLRQFLDYSWNEQTRIKVLEAVKDYAGEQQIEHLKDKVRILEERLARRERDGY